MRRFPVVLVYSWSIISLAFAMAYALLLLPINDPGSPLPAVILGYLWIGVLGMLIGNVLQEQQQRISQLDRERAPGKPDRS